MKHCPVDLVGQSLLHAYLLLPKDPRLYNSILTRWFAPFPVCMYAICPANKGSMYGFRWKSVPGIFTLCVRFWSWKGSQFRFQRRQRKLEKGKKLTRKVNALRRERDILFAIGQNNSETYTKKCMGKRERDRERKKRYFETTSSLDSSCFFCEKWKCCACKNKKARERWGDGLWFVGKQDLFKIEALDEADDDDDDDDGDGDGGYEQKYWMAGG